MKRNSAEPELAVVVEKPKAPNRKRWYVVRTRPRQHVRASIELSKLGCLVSMPMHHRTQRDGKWEVQVEAGLLFPPYIFVACRLPTHSPLAGRIREARGVSKLMCDSDGRPVPVPWREMQKIRRRGRKRDPKRATSKFTKDQRVKIIGGPFEGFDGIFEKPERERVRILLTLFGAQRSTEIEEKHLQAA